MGGKRRMFEIFKNAPCASNEPATCMSARVRKTTKSKKNLCKSIQNRRRQPIEKIVKITTETLSKTKCVIKHFKTKSKSKSKSKPKFRKRVRF